MYEECKKQIAALIAENECLAAACERAEQIIIAECKDASLANVRSNLLEADRDQIRAEIAGLRTGYEAYERVNAELKAESEGLINELKSLRSDNAQLIYALKQQEQSYLELRAERDQLKTEGEALRREREGKVLCDLELFETLRDSANTEADEHRQCMATYRPLRQASLDSVVKKCDDLLAALGKGEQS